MLALAIASAGASVHLAVQVAVDLWQLEDRPSLVRCHSEGSSSPRLAEPMDLDAVERQCHAADAARCELADALPLERAVDASKQLFGAEVPEIGFLRFSPAHDRVVWTLRTHQAGLTATIDAFDGDVIEFSAEGVTTN